MAVARHRDGRRHDRPSANAMARQIQHQVPGTPTNTIVSSTSPTEVSDRARHSPGGPQLREERGRVEQWRQEDHQHQVGIELDMGRPGTRPNARPPRTSTIGYGMPMRLADRVVDRHRHQQPGEDELEPFHA